MITEIKRVFCFFVGYEIYIWSGFDFVVVVGNLTNKFETTDVSA